MLSPGSPAPWGGRGLLLDSSSWQLPLWVFSGLQQLKGVTLFVVVVFHERVDLSNLPTNHQSRTVNEYMSFIPSTSQALRARPYAEAEGQVRPSQSCSPSSLRDRVLGPGLLETVEGTMSRMCRRHAYASTPCDRSSRGVQTWSAGTTVQKCLPVDPCPGTEHFAVAFGSCPGGGQA